MLESKPEQILNAFAVNGEIPVDLTFLATLKYKSDVIVHLTCSFQCIANYVYISGNNGAIRVSNVISSRDIKIEHFNANLEIISTKTIDAFNNFLAEINHFNNCIIYEEEPLITEHDSKSIMKTVEELFKVSEQNQF